MNQILLREFVNRKKGYLYYINGEGDICEAKMARGGKKKKKIINPDGTIKGKRYCIVCNEQIVGQRQKYCSQKCCSKNNGLPPKGYREGKFKDICKICDREFTKNNVNHQICSEECRTKYHNQVKSFEWFEKKNIDLNNYFLKLRFEVFKRDNFTCQYCGRNVKEDKIKLHLDHIIPKIKGGKNLPSNLITSCEECNLGKRDVLLENRQIIKNAKK